MDKLCTKCLRLQSISKQLTKQSCAVRYMTTNLKKNIVGKEQSSLTTSFRYYATKERSTEQKYRHGKLIVEEQEDPLLYPKLLITLTGKDEAVLENYFHFMKKAAKMTDVNVTKSFTMPATEEKYKAKRDGQGLLKEMEYNFKNFQRIIEVSDLTGDKSDIFLEYAQKSLPPGVSIKLEQEKGTSQDVDVKNQQRWEMLVDPNHVTLRDSNK